MAVKEPGPEKSDGGWTFMETLIVIAIVLILTSSVGFMTVQYLDRARTAAARSQIDSFAVALESYYIDCGRYPSAEQGLEALWRKPGSGSAENWSGPYLYKNAPLDPWGTPYEYKVPGENGLPFGIRSLGADGREGGEKYDADIASWEN
jgi:general secretion pathway protein G